MEQNKNIVANFIQKTYDILEVQFKLNFRIPISLILLNGQKMANNSLSRILNFFKTLSFPNISDIEIFIVLLGN